MSVEYLPESPAQKTQRILLTIWIIVFSSVVIWMYITNKDRAHEGQQARAALCIFRQDLQTRADGTAKYIREHPEGFPGIPVSVLKQSLDNQRATLKSLHKLNCIKPPIPKL